MIGRDDSQIHLIRFDDLSPTMRWDLWLEIEQLLLQHRIQPLVSIIPNNEDPSLAFEPGRPEFWALSRQWQQRGWIIGQHGFRHVYDSHSGGLFPWWPRSEFAGHPFDIQLERLTSGYKVLAQHGLQPTVFVAPSHSLDRVTVDALKQTPIRIISDGTSSRLHRDRNGILWMPLRPWNPGIARPRFETHCIHHNNLESARPVEEILRRYRGRILGQSLQFEELTSTAPMRSWFDEIIESVYWPAFSVRRTAARFVGRPLFRSRTPRSPVIDLEGRQRPG